MMKRRTFFPCLEQPLKCLICYDDSGNSNATTKMIAASRSVVGLGRKNKKNDNSSVYLCQKKQQQKNAEFLMIPCNATQQQVQEATTDATAGSSQGSQDQQQQQQWFMFKCANRDQGYLRVNFNGNGVESNSNSYSSSSSTSPTVTASSLEEEGIGITDLTPYLWRVEKISNTSGGENKYRITSAAQKPVDASIATALSLVVEEEEEETSSPAPNSHPPCLALTVNKKEGSICLVEEDYAITTSSASLSSWNLEFLSGELLFIRSSCSELESSESRSSLDNELSSSSSSSGVLVQQSPTVNGQKLSAATLGNQQHTQQPLQQQMQIRCNVLGQLCMTPECKGWEVWRFIESSTDGRVRIHSWMHQRYLSINRNNKDGTTYVCTTTEPITEWQVENAAGDGVIIRVAPDISNQEEQATGEENKSLLLCRTKDANGQTQLGIIATTSDATELVGGGRVVWQLDAAHQQIYMFHCADDNRSLGPFPWVTDNHKQTDQFDVEVEEELLLLEEENNNNDDGNTSISTITTAMIRSTRTNQYVGVKDNDGGGKDDDEKNGFVVSLQDTPYKWQLVVNADNGTYAFQQQQRQDYNNTPKMFLSLHKHETEDHAGPGQLSLQPQSPSSPMSTSWRLDPVMPRAVSSSKIRTFVGGTTIAVATTIAMPFAVAGVVGLMGTEMGLLGGAVAATLTGAEAVASVGVIGATAAICFSASRDSLSAALLLQDDDDDDDDEEENNNREYRKRYTKRPFCDWRSW